MKLSLPFFEKKEHLSYFLVLVLRNTKASAVIFEESNGVARVVGKHEEHFEESVENAKEEELLEVLDKTISKAESKLPSNVETQKTVFGVKEDWVENARIKKEYLAKLKRISDELGLVPIGFIITTEAIVNLLGKEEGAPISAILCEIDKDYICVSLARAGKIIESKNSKIEGSSAQTVDTLLKHFENAEILPSRIIIFNGEEDLSQDFINHSWSKNLPFLHLPQTTNLDLGFDAKAVLFGAASEMGFEILEGKEIKEQEIPQDLGIIEQEKEEVKDLEEPKIIHIREEVEEQSAEYFGFVKDKDVSEFDTPSKETPQNIPFEEMGEQIQEIPQELELEKEREPLSSNAFALGKGAKIILPKLLKKLKELLPMVSKLSFGKNKIMILPIGIALLLLALFAFYFFASHATVSISVNSTQVSKEQNVIFSTNSPTDASKNTIAAQFIEVSENGSTSTGATGKKDIGTPAKGKVTIFNTSGQAATLSAGLKITSSNNLVFTLDTKVSIPAGDPIDAGKTDANVTAADIGTNYNLPQTKFSFAGDNTIAAKNDNPFSGGTKKSITVVSKDDLAKLESDLLKKLEEKAKEDIGKKVSSDKIVLPVFISETLENKDFDRSAGDEVSQVTLKADVSYKGITYNKTDLIAFAKDALKGDSAANLTLDEDKIKTAVKDIKSKDNNQAETNLEIQGILLPKIEEANLTKQIAGKSFESATKILLGINQVTNVKIAISPNIPFFPKSLPRSSKNIKFKILVNE